MTRNIDFIGVVTTKGVSTGWAFWQGEITQVAAGANEEAVLAQLQPTPMVPVICVDQNVAESQSTPTIAIPEAFTRAALRHVLPSITQSSPVDILSAPSRLRIAGFLAQNKNWDGVILLLDQKLSQWIMVSANEIVSFQSFLTANLATLLNVPPETTADPDAVNQTMERPERIACHLRSAEINGDRGAIIGHLIGAEIVSARPYWLGQRIAIISDIETPQNWSTPLAAQGVPLQFAQSQAMAVAGLIAANNT